MNKTVAAVLAVLIVVGGGVGYYLYANNDDSSTVSSSTKETDKKAAEAAKSLDVANVLSNVKAQYSTVTETKVFDESNDPNSNMLGKPGSYVSGGAFKDTRSDYTSSDDKWGTDAGGAIEVYATEADAIKRGEYFSKFDQSSMLSPGAYKQVGNVVVRASSSYPKSVQDEVIAFLEQQVK